MKIGLQTALIMVVSLCVSAGQATALPGLNAVQTVSINVEIRGEADVVKHCSVNEDRVRTAAAYPLVGSGLGLDDRSFVHLGIVLTILPERFANGQKFGCASAVTMMVIQVDQSIARLVLLWTDDGLILGPPDSFAQQLDEAVSDGSKKLIVERAKARSITR